MIRKKRHWQLDKLFYPADRPMAALPCWEHHVHSEYSDGTSPVAEIIARALAQGIERLILTEHTEPELVAGPGWFVAYVRTVRELRAAVRDELTVLIGLEVPILDMSGHLLINDAMLAQAEFILGAVHAYPGHGWNLDTIEPARAIDLEYRALLALTRHPDVDAIAHPGGVCTKYVTPFPMELFDEVVRQAAANGKAIELNPAYHEPLLPYLEICRKHGALISPGSNAHRPEEMGLAWEELKKLQVGRRGDG
ncbi:MAG: PHP domain-containing protein [Magnetococcales bacterium]|nr:PHP domain-containing protein [Magnetococcales bacterium]